MGKEPNLSDHQSLHLGNGETLPRLLWSLRMVRDHPKWMTCSNSFRGRLQRLNSECTLNDKGSPSGSWLVKLKWFPLVGADSAPCGGGLTLWKAASPRAPAAALYRGSPEARRPQLCQPGCSSLGRDASEPSSQNPRVKCSENTWGFTDQLVVPAGKKTGKGALYVIKILIRPQG